MRFFVENIDHLNIELKQKGNRKTDKLIATTKLN